MKQAKFFMIIVILLLAALAACDDVTNNQKEITNFEECIAAGNAIIKTKPAKCQAEGKTFIEELNEDVNSDKTIETRAGKLTLSYNGGTATLTSILQRSTPCVNWTVDVMTTKDLPISTVNIKIFDSNKADVCIQVLGQPQEIRKTIMQVSENTKYTMIFEDETVFEEKLITEMSENIQFIDFGNELGVLGTEMMQGKEFVMNSNAEYNKLLEFKPRYMLEDPKYQSFELPSIDFSKYTLIGFYADGSGCKTNFHKDVKLDKKSMKLTYLITVEDVGLCEPLHSSMNWILVSKLPENYSVEFKGDHVQTKE